MVVLWRLCFERKAFSSSSVGLMLMTWFVNPREFLLLLSRERPGKRPCPQLRWPRPLRLPWGRWGVAGERGGWGARAPAAARLSSRGGYGASIQGPLARCPLPNPRQKAHSMALIKTIFLASQFVSQLLFIYKV